MNLTATVIVVSDSVSAGVSRDRSGAILLDGLATRGLQCGHVVVVPDEIDQIRSAIRASDTNLIALTGGTGIGPRDVTPEAVLDLLDKRLSGMEEAIRAEGMKHNARAMLSRCVAGIRGKQLILCLPGSPNAVTESLDVLFPPILHAFEMLEGAGH